MKDLLLAIRTELQASINQVKDLDVFIAEDEMILPDSISFPALGLKDGPGGWNPETNTSFDRPLDVRISVYSRVLKPEESIIGDKGVLTILDAVTSRLNNNLLGLAGYYQAFPVSEEASQTFGDGRDMIQKKTVVMRYNRQQTI